MRQDQFNVTVTVKWNNETKDLGTFDKMTGGGVDSEETKYRPGNMGAEVPLGGYKTVENIVLSRLYDLSRDQADLGWLLSAVGKGTAEVKKQFLDVDGNPKGKAIVYGSGRLKRVTPPEVDSESTDAALIELEISTGSSVAIAA